MYVLLYAYAMLWPPYPPACFQKGVYNYMAGHTRAPWAYHDQLILALLTLYVYKGAI
jgi:hypothetical protein